MLNQFLEANRAELIERCRAKVELRPAPPSAGPGLAHGIPVFLDQMVERLRFDRGPEPVAAGPPAQTANSSPKDPPRTMTASARMHGDEMMRRGYTIDQVVHDYGDLCQAITELAAETGARISAGEFQFLNRCLDDAIADAITEFQAQRDRHLRARERRDEADRLGSLAHELRDLLGTASLAFHALKRGVIGTSGATSAVLERNLRAMGELVGRTVAEVRLEAGISARFEPIRLDHFIADVHMAASLSAETRDCELHVSEVEPTLFVRADRQLLHSAVANLVGNALKFTRRGSHVTLRAIATDQRALIEVRDECGGLPEGAADALFAPFEQRGADRTGLGLGLSIARRAVEAMSGSIRVTDMPGRGCVFTIDLPRLRAGPGGPVRKDAPAAWRAGRAANDHEPSGPDTDEAPRDARLVFHFGPHLR